MALRRERPEWPDSAQEWREAEKRLLATGRDGRRLPPAQIMLRACVAALVMGVVLAIVVVLVTAGPSSGESIARDGWTQLACGGLIVCLPIVAVGAPLFEVGARWYLKGSPYPNIMRYRVLRYRAVLPALLLFFLGAAAVLGIAYLADGGDLVGLLVPPQWQ